VDLNELDEIKNKLDIVEYIGKYVPLKQAGRNFKGLCPFHNEKTGSFMVSSDKQIFHCFGCGKGGDVVSFVQEIEGVDFPTALKELAEKAGVKLPEYGNYKKEPVDRLYEVNNSTSEIYERELWDKKNIKVLDYLRGRGMTDDTIKQFRLGFAPSGGDIIVRELTKLGFIIDELFKAGVAKETVKAGQSPWIRDQFFNRITFPIMNPSGKIVAFTARVLDDSLPKYINTPETAIYHKSDVLFCFDKAKEQVRKQDHIIIVEGQMDAIFSYQAGVKNVVATSGTAMTDHQLGLIKRFTKNIKMAFDVDMAGQNATRRAIELAWERDFNIKVIEVPEGKDPADLVKSDPKKWVESCRKAKYVVDYIFDSTFEKYDITNILYKKQATRELLAIIQKLADPVEKEHYLNLLAARVGVSVGALEGALAKITTTKAREPQASTKGVDHTPAIHKETREEHALSLLLILPRYIEFFFNKLSPDDFTEENIRSFVSSIHKAYEKSGSFDKEKWLKKLDQPSLDYVNRLMLATEDTFADADDELLGEEIFYSIVRLKHGILDTRKKELNARLQMAESSGDKKLQTKLLREFQELIEEERNV
jgi:DNA primase